MMIESTDVLNYLIRDRDFAEEQMKLNPTHLYNVGFVEGLYAAVETVERVVENTKSGNVWRPAGGVGGGLLGL